jgi:hypothetical protein
MGVSTVETNRDRDRERPSCRDQFLKPVEIFSTVEIDFYFISVEIDFYFISVEIFKIKIFRSRFIFVEIFIEIVETNRDCRDKSRLSRQIKTNRDFSRYL